MQSRLMTLLLLIIALNGGHALAHGSPAPPGQEDPSGPQTTRGLMSEEVLQHKLATQGYVLTEQPMKLLAPRASRQALPKSASGLEGPAYRAYVYEMRAVKDGAEVTLEIDALTGQIREKGVGEPAEP